MKRPPKVLIIDDEKEVCTFFDFLLQEKGYDVYLAHDGQEAQQLLAKENFDLALVDLKLPDTDGIRLLANIKRLYPECEVIIMTGYSTVKSAISAIKLGAFDYIEKPFDDLDKLEQLIEQAVAKQTSWGSSSQNLASDLARYGIIVAPDSPLIPILALAKKVADKDINVIIQGETGVGKELIARYIHSQSCRAAQPFIAINCGAFTESLLESELFGHEKGAFTGANGARKGIFQIADGGTLFLDEIGEASMSVQVKLLRVLEAGEFMRVGGEYLLSTDVRIIAATNVNLKRLITAEKFRKDLFYRLNVVMLEIPPLLQRSNDIPYLVRHFINNCKFNKDNNVVSIKPEVMKMLKKYPWPGNVRELGNVIAQSIAVCTGKEIKLEHLPEQIKSSVHKLVNISSSPVYAKNTKDIKEVITFCSEYLLNNIDPLKINLEDLINEFKNAERYIAKRTITEVLKYTNGDKSKAAKLLKITPRKLRYLLNEK